MAGKWSQAGVPHEGWISTSVEDFGAPDDICEMCETRDIRNAHHAEHPDYPETLGVGWVCAENMENGYEALRRRECALGNADQPRQHGLCRNRKISARRNADLKADRINITVFQMIPTPSGARTGDRVTGQSVKSKRRYTSKDAASLRLSTQWFSSSRKPAGVGSYFRIGATHPANARDPTCA